MRRIRTLAAFALVLAALGALLLAPGGKALQPGVVELVSFNTAETESGNANSTYPFISANGRVVVYGSLASDIAATDTNDAMDVFARDLDTETTHLVSVNSAGTDTGEASSGAEDISSTGRYVAFTSNASDIVPTDGNGFGDVFVRDLLNQTTELVSVNSAGTDTANGSSRNPVISDDGRFVAFESFASNLSALDPDATLDVFLRDLLLNTTTLISTDLTGTTSANSTSRAAVITPNGRYIVFESFATDIAAVDTNAGGDIFIRDRLAAAPTLVSANSAGSDTGNAASTPGYVSSDGRYVSFEGTGSNFGPVDGNGVKDIYVRDVTLGTTELISVNGAGTDSGVDESFVGIMSSNGRYVSFMSDANDLGPVDTNGSLDVYIRDRNTDTTSLVSANFSGTDSLANGGINHNMSADGSAVTFGTTGDDIVEGVNSLNGDVFFRRWLSGTTIIASPNLAGTGGANDFSQSPALSSDGSVITYFGFASDLVAQDTNDHQNVFAFSPAPDLMITKADTGVAALPGESIRYDLTYLNGTVTTATGVVLEETVPANTTFNAAGSEPGWVCTPNGNPGSTCTLAIGSLAGGAGGTADFSVFVDDPVAGGVTEITNTATISNDGSNGGDQNPNNNSATVVTPLATGTPGPTPSPSPTLSPTPIGQTPSPTPVGQTPSPTPSPTPFGQTPEPTPVGQTVSPSPTASPTPSGQERTWGDDNCSGEADPIDSLLTLRFDAGLSTNTGDCPAMGDVVEVANASPHPWGDVDCGGDVNPVDSLKLLRFDAGLPVAQADGCPQVGSAVIVSEVA